MSTFILQSDLGNTLDTSSGQVQVNLDGVTMTASGSGELVATQQILSGDIPNNSIIITNPDGSTQTLDLTPIITNTEVFVNGGNYNAASMQLTLTDQDPGTPDVVINLAALLGASSDPDNILGNGADGKPTLTATDICDVIKADCVANPGTPCTDLAGNPLGYLIAV